ncbi:sigma-70 family RNA polymerase sigma factor [Vibrio vulnificus]|nr:sigma-70 family RNA polymerase sigma factor [Vibrio vulnificus]EIZ1408502.1 sigma-70 family RNA polymerase sigma factor [Vibrio vulnificus]EIZ1412271.1 sigma-70 family RNA polymerase sigma factor [Vibrio vulnificus]EJA3293447.1 sigma-70 family RNA polymerase sigma factor [Vibrio vulnificus]EJA3297141.1 sigma-70 family RNA polymerase sigma factor [Vibrio vulnificus]
MKVNRDQRCSQKEVDIIYLYSGWVRGVAKSMYVKYKSPGVELGDFIQYASIGLIESAYRFDNRASVQFTSFAYLRVKGTILNNIYKFSDTGSLLYSRFRRERERLDSLKENDKPRDLEEYSNLVIELACVYLLDEKSDEAFALSYSDIAYSQYSNYEESELARNLVWSLPENMRKVMTLHYYQHISFSDIAKMMGISKARISQIHAQAITKIKARLESNSHTEL